MDKILNKFIIVPIVALLGIYIIGILLQDLFGASEVVKILFWVIFGVGFLASYFRSLLN